MALGWFWWRLKVFEELQFLPHNHSGLPTVGHTNRGCSAPHVQSVGRRKSCSCVWPLGKVKRHWPRFTSKTRGSPVHVSSGTRIIQPEMVNLTKTKSSCQGHRNISQSNPCIGYDIVMCQILSLSLSISISLSIYIYIIDDACMKKWQKKMYIYPTAATASSKVSETPMLGKSMRPGGSTSLSLCHRQPRGSWGSTTRREPFWMACPWKFATEHGSPARQISTEAACWAEGPPKCKGPKRTEKSASNLSEACLGLGVSGVGVAELEITGRWKKHGKW